MDYDTTSVYTKKINDNLDTVEIEELIVELGFKISQVYYMTTENFEIVELE